MSTSGNLAGTGTDVTYTDVAGSIQVLPLQRVSSAPTYAPETSIGIDDQVDAWASNDPGTPPNDLENNSIEGVFIGESSHRRLNVNAPLLSSRGFTCSSVSRSNRPCGHVNVEQDLHFLNYPEFSGYPHDHKQEVEVEVLRKRRQTKENLREVAEQFNKVPMKPDWLLRALELGCIEKSKQVTSEDDLSGSGSKVKTLEEGEKIARMSHFMLMMRHRLLLHGTLLSSETERMQPWHLPAPAQLPFFCAILMV